MSIYKTIFCALRLLQWDLKALLHDSFIPKEFQKEVLKILNNFVVDHKTLDAISMCQRFSSSECRSKDHLLPNYLRSFKNISSWGTHSENNYCKMPKFVFLKDIQDDFCALLKFEVHVIFSNLTRISCNKFRNVKEKKATNYYYSPTPALNYSHLLVSNHFLWWHLRNIHHYHLSLYKGSRGLVPT